MKSRTETTGGGRGGRARAGFALAVFLASAGASVLPAAGAGGRPGEIFNFGAGARPLAMGSAYTAMARDASAVYYNPSGLALLPGPQATVMHASLYEDASYEYLGYAHNFGAIPGGWGLQFLRLSGGSAEGRDEYNNRTAAFGYSETALSAGAGVRGLFLPVISAGIALKVVNRTLDGRGDQLVGADLGAQYGPLFNGRLTFGITAQNALSLAVGDTEDKLPLTTRFGVSYALVSGVALSAEAAGDGGFRFGTEYTMGPGALRLGYDRNMLTFGGGVKFLRSYQFDFAMVKHAELGLSQRISLGYNFGAVSRQEKPKIYARDLVAKAGRELKAGAYGAALKDMDLACGLDEGAVKGPLAEKRRRLGAIIPALGLDRNPELEKYFRGGEPQAEEAALAMAEYLEGRGLRAFLLAQSAAGYAPNEAFYSDFLRAVAKQTDNEVRKDEILPRTLLVQEKIKKASAAFYVQKFEYAARQCEETLLLDDGNALVWTRLGSAYYMMGDKERARRAYTKALELNPGDGATLEFMRGQGWK